MTENNLETMFLKCRNLMTDRINQSMTSMINEVEDTLYEMAENEKGLGKAAQYFDAIRLFRIKKYEIKVRFEKRFISLYKYRTENFLKILDDTDVTLSKVGHSSFMKEDDSLEEKKVFEDSVEKVKKDCQYALLNLDRKMSGLLNGIDIKDSDSPMLPDIVFEAFWESCRDVEMRSEIRILLINLFEKYIALDLKYCYEDLNAELSSLDLESK